MKQVNAHRKKVVIDDIKRIPLESGVYFLFQKGLLVYIGKALNLQKRIKDHVVGKVFDEIEYELAHWSRSRELEEELLKGYHNQHGQYPYYNHQG